VRWGRFASDFNSTETKPEFSTAQLHFSFLAKYSTCMVYEKHIHAVFSHFGEIKEISFKKISFDSTGRQHGYGFIHFPVEHDGISAAVNASHIVKKLELNNVVYDCELNHGLSRYLHSFSSSGTHSCSH
jgi:hypothetical protein